MAGWIRRRRKSFSFQDSTNTDDKDVNDILESDDEDEDVDVDYGGCEHAIGNTAKCIFRSSFTTAPPTNVHVIQEPLPMDEEIVEALRSMGDTGAGGGIFKAKNASSVPNLPNDMSMSSPQPSRQRDSIDEDASYNFGLRPELRTKASQVGSSRNHRRSW
jgi:hypothetical protein